MENLNHKISSAIGKHHKNHYSNVRQDRIHPNLVLQRIGQRGWFSLSTAPKTNDSELFNVMYDGRFVGRMTIPAIKAKFGRNV